ncbi:MAG: TrmB family transcriptional regulator [Nitrospirae bacterium]|nr:TrmB family transcriptional regulator [Nitrospirota bacterium]
MVDNNKTDIVIKHLMYLGFSEYEAKVYLTLLRESPATAYEVGKSSGVPTSKVYRVLEKLIEKGNISIIDEKKTAKYIPIPPQDLVERYKDITENILTSLMIRLSDFKTKRSSSYIWNITDYSHLINKTNQSIKATTRTILLSIWKEELTQIEKEILEAHRRGVKIAIVHFGQPSVRIGQMYLHPIENTIYHEKGEKGFIAVIDSREIIMGTIFRNNRVEGAWSSNVGFVTIIEDYIKHDIYIMKILRRFDRILIERFGGNYTTLRDIFSDRDLT